YAAADQAGVFADEILPVPMDHLPAPANLVDRDEHPRPQVTLEKLAKLPGVNGPGSSVTAGNASGINDG
ncbi:MAG: 3-oxoadipyl-CoA thiolase, partial [Candidatus Puniceispirillaceae bacterium]